MPSVMVFGTFDPLHRGHRALFRQARALAGDDTVFAVVARDRSIRRLKKREPRQSEAERLAAVSADPLIDEALLGHPTAFLQPILKKRPDILLLGYDQKTFSPTVLREQLARHNYAPRILRAAPFRPEIYKSSKLAQKPTTQQYPHTTQQSPHNQ